MTKAPTRTDVRIPCGGDRLAAWLYPPWPGRQGTPVVVMAHGLSGTRRDRLSAFADRFAAAGYAALVFDHRGFGDSEGSADVFDPRRQQADWATAIAFARTVEGVDPERVVAFGSSMGGGNALAAAAGDPRVAAAISQVPFLDLMAQAHKSSLRVRRRMFVAAARNKFLPAVGQPDEAAFINAPDAEEGWRHVVAIGEDSRWRNRASARWILAGGFRPGRLAGRLHCPWLVCVGEADQVAAPGPAIRAARRAPLGELRLYPGVDHFDVYDGPEHEALLADQLEFLGRHVPVAEQSGRGGGIRTRG